LLVPRFWIDDSVGPLYCRKTQSDLFRRQQIPGSMAVTRITADDHVKQLVGQVRLLLVLDRRAEMYFDFLKKRAVRAGFLEFIPRPT